MTTMVTGEQVKDAMTKAGITFAAVRQCSICERPLFFERRGEDVFFDSNCECVRAISQVQPRTWEEAAAIINQRAEGPSKTALAKEFGLTI